VRKRAVILTEIIAPYRIPVFNALAERSDIDPHVIFLAENDPALRLWHVYKDEIKFSYEVLRGWRGRWGKHNVLLNAGVGTALRRARTEALVCGGYNYFASWQAAWWATRNAVPLLLWSESNATDKRRNRAPVEFLKRRFSGMCRAFVAAGVSSRDYLIELGAPTSSVFIAPDAVDVQMYAARAVGARARRAELRAEHHLPERYFLYVGRLVEEKGVFDLLAAYAALDDGIRAQVGLVFVGDGAVRTELERQAAKIHTGGIRFPGWVHRERISEFYALAEALVFPTHSDPWGLVVNEAMACSLPIVASDVAGCVADLVRVSKNGFTFRPRDTGALSRILETLAGQPDLAERMGAESFEMIHSHTPEACAAGLAAAINFGCENSAE
jgi:glycosyltransferase involved in cell wall biosynthesis